MEWQAIVLVMQILLLAVSWFLFQQARAELTARAAETPVMAEVKTLHVNVKKMLDELEQTADRSSSRLENGAEAVRELLGDLETERRDTIERCDLLTTRSVELEAWYAEIQAGFQQAEAVVTAQIVRTEETLTARIVQAEETLTARIVQAEETLTARIVQADDTFAARLVQADEATAARLALIDNAAVSSETATPTEASLPVQTTKVNGSRRAAGQKRRAAEAPESTESNSVTAAVLLSEDSIPAAEVSIQNVEQPEPVIETPVLAVVSNERPTEVSSRTARRNEVYALIDSGQLAPAVARRTGISEGEVETLIGLRVRRA